MPGGSSTASTKSATIEMYVGSSYNDTMSGETLSSISEKSESYISANGGNATTVLSEIPSTAERSHYPGGARINIHKHHEGGGGYTHSYSHTLQHPSRHRHPQSPRYHHHQYSPQHHLSPAAALGGISSPGSGGLAHNHHHMHLHPPTSIDHTDDFEEVIKCCNKSMTQYILLVIKTSIIEEQNLIQVSLCIEG